MTKQTRDILIKGASLLGGQLTDIALSGGVIVAIGRAQPIRCTTRASSMPKA